MSTEDHLEEAVSKGIIEPGQAEALRQLAGTSAAAPMANLAHNADLDAGDDEGFRFISGFNDIFLALGVIMLLYGMAKSGFSTGITGHAINAVILWALAELFAGWLKRTLPSMIIVAMFVFHVLGIASLYLFGTEFRQLNPFEFIDGLSLSPLFAVGIGAALLFYLRFKLPFSLFIAALQIVALVVISATITLEMEMVSYAIPLLLVMGLLLFATAMWFDASDRLRLTRLSDNAFWLHLIASPLIVHSIMWQSAIWITGIKDVRSLDSLENIAPVLAIVVLAIFTCIMIVALIIDRRAMLVSSLLYVSVAITYIISQQGNVLSAASFTPILIGVAIIALGIGWRPLRRFLFTILPLGSIEARLPPIRS